MAPGRLQKARKRDRIELPAAPTETTSSTSAPSAVTSTPASVFKTLLAAAKVRQAKTTFLSLPAEIRTIIYTYALYHSNNGIIASPTSPVPSLSDRVGSGTVFDPVKVEDDEENDRLSRSHKECRSECLIQPGITRVSRLLRTEALPIFYNINTFKFDAAKYKNVDARSRDLPKRWWRAIGDTNLRAIKSFRLIDSAGLEDETALRFEFKYVETKESKSVHVHAKNSLYEVFSRFAEIRSGWEDCTEQLERDGLFVRGIERIASEAGYEAFKAWRDSKEWPAKAREGEVVFDSWGGEHHAYVGKKDVGVAGFGQIELAGMES